MRVAIACGGTGGHFYPGYALARELKRRGHEALFLIRDNDPAKPLLEAQDLPSVEIHLRGLSRRPSLSWFTILPKTLCAVRMIGRVFRSYRPNVFVGMGAYVTGASAAAARLGRIPIVLHESNSVLGLANQVVSRFSNSLALGLPLTEPVKIGVLTGTPIREALYQRGDSSQARRDLGLKPGLRTILILGGSQGASALNLQTPAALEALGEPVQAYHLCGKGHLETTKEAYSKINKTVFSVVAEYDADMVRAYAAADAVICRAGASTAAELLAQRLPAVLIPYPYAAADHQTHNARALENAGLGQLLEEENLTPDTLARALMTLPKDLTESPEIKIGLPPAAESVRRLADIVEQTAKAVR